MFLEQKNHHIRLITEGSCDTEDWSPIVQSTHNWIRPFEHYDRKFPAITSSHTGKTHCMELCGWLPSDEQVKIPTAKSQHKSSTAFLTAAWVNWLYTGKWVSTFCGCLCCNQRQCSSHKKTQVYTRGTVLLITVSLQLA